MPIRIWPDVYRTKTAHGDDVYLKLTVIDDALIVVDLDVEGLAQHPRRSLGPGQ